MFCNKYLNQHANYKNNIQFHKLAVINQQYGFKENTIQLALSNDQLPNEILHKPSEIITNNCSVKENNSKYVTLEYGDKSRYACTLCDKKFTRISAFRSHMSFHRPPVEHECVVCGAVFSSRKEQSSHKCTIKPYYFNKICSKCGYLSDTIGSYRKHVAKCHPDSITKKPKKSTILMNKSLLVSHDKETNDLRESTRFAKLKASEFIKKLLHQDKTDQNMGYSRNRLDKNTHCNACLKYFSFPSQLTRHMLIQHSKEKHYKCSVCNKQYRHKNSLKIHTDKHLMSEFNGNKDYKAFTNTSVRKLNEIKQLEKPSRNYKKPNEKLINEKSSHQIVLLSTKSPSNVINGSNIGKEFTFEPTSNQTSENDMSDGSLFIMPAESNTNPERGIWFNNQKLLINQMTNYPILISSPSSYESVDLDEISIKDFYYY